LRTILHNSLIETRIQGHKQRMAISPVYFYIANLITGSRILFAIVAFAFVFTNPWVFFFCYGISAVNDIADGHFARKYNQVSKLGAVLDMVTDRASTTCLIMVLTQLYPRYIFFFLTSVGMDIMSHFAHVVSQLSRGIENHKQVSAHQGWVLRLYYSNRLVLGFLCGFNEAFFALMYLNYFWSGPSIHIGLWAAKIGCPS